MASQATKLAYFYSDADRNLVNLMEANLSVLKMLGFVELWCKKNIKFGEINLQIVEAVKESKIVVFFFSTNFIINEYETLSNLEIDGQPLKDWILNKHTEGEILFLPILLSNIAGFAAFPESNLAVPKGASLGGLEKPARDNACAKIGEMIIEYVKKSADDRIENPLPRPRKMPPPLPVSLLPQLCGRGEQSCELRTVFDRYKTAAPTNEKKRPFVFVIHGESEECPEGYKERLEKREFPEFLGLDYEEPIKFCNLVFPRESYDIAEPRLFFERTLRERFFDSYTAEPQTVLSDYFNQFRTVIINYDIFSENWNKRIIESLLDFWNTLPIRNTRTTVIVNLIFSYDENTDSDKQNNFEARSFFQNLKQNLGTTYANIGITVTPELDAIEKAEVVTWLNEPKVFRDFCPQHTPNFCDPATVRRQINDLYGDSKTPRRFSKPIRIEGQAEAQEVIFIRMRTLSDKLGKLLVTVKKRTHF